MNETIQPFKFDEEMDLDHEHGLNEAVYNHIVSAAYEAATLAIMRALQSQAMNPTCNDPVPPDHPNSDGNELETGIPLGFERTCPCSLIGCVVVTPL
jgi:hypothetical protein